MISLLLLIGSLFVFATSVGINRLGDDYSRLHVGTKAATLGLTSVLIACLLFFWGEGATTTKVILTVVFLFLTSPVSAHLVATAAYRSGSPKWDRTVWDEAAQHLPRRDPAQLPPINGVDGPTGDEIGGR